jgi:hypothetical protein
MVVEANRYLTSALSVLKSNSSPLLILGIGGVVYYAPRIAGKGVEASFFLPLIVFLILYPMIYGRYAEIVLENKEISYFQILNTHWFNYFVVSIMIGSPVILVSFLGPVLGKAATVLWTILSPAVNVLSIYIIPLVFLLQRRLESVSLGIKCLLGNIVFSLPLIFLTLLPPILSLLIRVTGAGADYSPKSFMFHYLFFLISIFLDFTVFIAAAIILKEKILAKR